MRYGMPYKGSKNSIAKWIISNLPESDTLADLFCGGGAITHAAILSGRYKRIMMNDIDGRLPRLFCDSIAGKYTTETQTAFVDRATFNARKMQDAYIALIWSFGNGGRYYMYSAEIEAQKKALHEYIFNGDCKALREFGIDILPADGISAYKRYLRFKKTMRGNGRRYDLESLERLQRLERLQHLRGQNLIPSGTDYRQIKIPEGAVIYCDIPYANTDCGKYSGFNHAAFYDWAEYQDNIFISEYSMPEQFIEIASIKKSILSTNTGEAGKATEKLFTNKRTFERIKCNLFEQLTLF